MHEDITVSDNSLFFLPAEKIFNARTNTFLFPLLFLYLCTDRELGFHSPVASHLQETKQRLPAETRTLCVHVSATRSENAATFL